MLARVVDEIDAVSTAEITRLANCGTFRRLPGRNAAIVVQLPFRLTRTAWRILRLIPAAMRDPAMLAKRFEDAASVSDAPVRDASDGLIAAAQRAPIDAAPALPARALFRGFNRGLAGVLDEILAIGPVAVFIGLLRRVLLSRSGAAQARQDDLTLSTGLTGNLTLQTDLDLWRVSREASPSVAAIVRDASLAWTDARARIADDHDGARFLAAFDGFIATHGHRGLGEQDIANPRWCDDPSFVVAALRNYLAVTDDEQSPVARHRAAAVKRETLAADLDRWMRASVVRRPFAGIVSKMIRACWALIPIRENAKYHVLRSVSHARRGLMAIGAWGVRAGVFDRAEDIFDLDTRAIVRFASAPPSAWPAFRAEVAESQRKRRLWSRVVPPELVLTDGTVFHARAALPADPNALVGVPVSPGVVTGIARVILDPSSDARIAPGEILIAPHTDPAWTPLFMTAAGFAMEVGGAMSHGAMVAREFGIPALVGVVGATTRVRSGDRVTVDAVAGRLVREQAALT
jgi:pyruvate,water dikinase